MKPIAKLIPTLRERGYGKNTYAWIPAYKVITPEGTELQPHMRMRGNRFEESARSYCERQGWQCVIVK